MIHRFRMEAHNKRSTGRLTPPVGDTQHISSFEPMPTTVVFDTNAYRQLVHGLGAQVVQATIGDLRLREERAGFRGAASPYVMLELLAHLADPADPAFTDCLLALRAQQLHCQVGAGTGQLALLGDFESHLARVLYNTALPDHDHVTNNVALIAQSFHVHPTDDHILRARPYLVEIEAFVTQSERDFVDDVHNFVVRSLKPDATDWAPLRADAPFRATMLAHLRSADALTQIAGGLVLKAMVQAHKTVLPDPEFDRKVAFVVDHFSTPLRLYRAILVRIVSTGCDLTKRNRSNWLWDIQISFAVGCHLNALPIQIVTGDQDIVAAATEADAGDSVLSLEEHLSRLPA